jgi:hypothetical protein
VLRDVDRNAAAAVAAARNNALTPLQDRRKKRINHSWLISSKNDRMSASSIQFTFLRSIPTQSKLRV